MSDYRYRLGSYSEVRKVTCPNCGHKTFVRFIDTKTGAILDGYGRCDREIKCGFFKAPGKEFKPKFFPHTPRVSSIKAEPITDEYEKLPNNDNENLLYWYLTEYFSETAVSKVLDLYKVKCFKGFTTFPQIDREGQIWTAKCIKYKPDGHRSKDVNPFWLHNIFKKGVPNRVYFGTHLIQDDETPIVVVESEKTAIVSALWFDFGGYFIATGGINFDPVRLRIFKNPIILLPDNDGLSRWQKIATEQGFAIYPIEKFTHSESGFDFADIISETLGA